MTVITEANEVLHLKEGDVIVELVSKVHYGVNNGSVPVEIVMFYVGNEDLQITIPVKD